MAVSKLTSDEISAIFGCRYFGTYWGTSEDGLCPAATVAQMRGAQFELRENYYHPKGAIVSPDADLAFQAVQDIADWLSFKSRAEFYAALDVEGAKILDRAPKPNGVSNGTCSSS